MKSSQIAQKYNININEFEYFIKQNKLNYSEGFKGLIIDDSNVLKYVALFIDSKEKFLKRKAEQQAKKNNALTQMLISSGFSFEGYHITKYSGYISGDDAITIPRSGFFGSNNGSNLTNALVKIRRQALTELKEAAYNLGCNAVVGVDFDYITIAPETANLTGGTLYEPYVICVTANGNAVIIEKN